MLKRFIAADPDSFNKLAKETGATHRAASRLEMKAHGSPAALNEHILKVMLRSSLVYSVDLFVLNRNARRCGIGRREVQIICRKTGHALFRY